MNYWKIFTHFSRMLELHNWTTFISLSCLNLPQSHEYITLDFYCITVCLGISAITPKPLVRNFDLVPDPTNVYTAYDVYFRDFCLFRNLVPTFLILHYYWLYRKASLAKVDSHYLASVSACDAVLSRSIFFFFIYVDSDYLWY